MSEVGSKSKIHWLRQFGRTQGHDLRSGLRHSRLSHRRLRASHQAQQRRHLQRRRHPGQRQPVRRANGVLRVLEQPQPQPAAYPICRDGDRTAGGALDRGSLHSHYLKISGPRGTLRQQQVRCDFRPPKAEVTGSNPFRRANSACHGSGKRWADALSRAASR